MRMIGNNLFAHVVGAIKSANTHNSVRLFRDKSILDSSTFQPPLIAGTGDVIVGITPSKYASSLQKVIALSNATSCFNFRYGGSPGLGSTTVSTNQMGISFPSIIW